MRATTRASLLGLVMTSAAASQFSRVARLAGSVYDKVGVCNARVQDTANEITLRTKRLTSFLSGANALYSKGTNQILVEGELFTGSRLKDLEELTGGFPSYYEAIPVAATIYHELGHAEWDVFIEEGETAQDRAFYRVVKQEIVPWIDSHEAGVDSEWLAVQEWHGYFRGRLIDVLLTDWSALLQYNGITPSTLEVDEGLAASYLRQGKILPADFGRLSPRVLPGDHGDDVDTPYSTRIRGYSFTVSNGMIDGQVEVDTGGWTAARGFRDAWWQAIWDHTDHFFCLHDDMASLIRRMEAALGREKLAHLREVRQAAWDALSVAERERILAALAPAAAATPAQQVGGSELYGVRPEPGVSGAPGSESIGESDP